MAVRVQERGLPVKPLQRDSRDRAASTPQEHTAWRRARHLHRPDDRRHGPVAPRPAGDLGREAAQAQGNRGRLVSRMPIDTPVLILL